jgi:23S rRNA (cytosine1962-C5)-methyltransferase
MEVASATLKPREERRLLRGHLWAYRNEFKQLPDAQDGALVDVFTSQRRFVGRGFFQASGGIAVRLLTRHQETIDGEYLESAIRRAHAYRETCFPGEATYRWVFGESDGLPGLVIDRYGPLAVAVSDCAFYAAWADSLAEVLLKTEGVFYVHLRLGGDDRIVGDPPEEIPYSLDGAAYTLRLDGTQKTGAFLDQRCNRQAIAHLVRDARVLDGHCYHGHWSVAAASAGAGHVTGVDTSGPALDQARANAEANGVADRCTFQQQPVEDALKTEEPYDVVIVDPPAYAKARAQRSRAIARYRTLNTAAMAAVKPGGYLVSCSCSHFVDPAAFQDMLKQAAAGAQRTAWLVEMRGAGPDHPVLLAMPETAYLKCAILRVL